MKPFAVAVMLVALYLMYRMAYPKRTDAKTGDDAPSRRKTAGNETMGKSRFVPDDRGRSRTTSPALPNPEKRDEKVDTFASGNRGVETPAPEEAPEEDDEEDDEEFRTMREGEEATEFAGGFSIEEMEAVARAVADPTNENDRFSGRSDGTGAFAKLVRDDDGESRRRIAEVIDRHLRSVVPEVPNEGGDGGKSDADVADFLKRLKS